MMLAIQLINAILISITAPYMGKLVDRIGEKGPLKLYSIGLILVFLGYASFRNMWTLAWLFFAGQYFVQLQRGLHNLSKSYSPQG